MDYKKYEKEKKRNLDNLNKIIKILENFDKRSPKRNVNYNIIKTVYILFYFYIKKNLIELKILIENESVFLEVSLRKFFETLLDFNYIFSDLNNQEDVEYKINLYFLFSQYKKYELAKEFSIQGIDEKQIFKAEKAWKKEVEKKNKNIENKILWTGQKRSDMYLYEKEFTMKLYKAMSKDGHSSFSNIASMYIDQEKPSIYINQYDKEINFMRLNRVALIRYVFHYTILILLKMHEDKIIKFKSGEKKELIKILKSL